MNSSRLPLTQAYTASIHADEASPDATTSLRLDTTRAKILLSVATYLRCTLDDDSNGLPSLVMDDGGLNGGGYGDDRHNRGEQCDDESELHGVQVSGDVWGQRRSRSTLPIPTGVRLDDEQRQDLIGEVSLEVL